MSDPGRRGEIEILAPAERVPAIERMVMDRRRLLAVGAGGAMAAFLAACGGGGASAPQATTAAATTAGGGETGATAGGTTTAAAPPELEKSFLLGNWTDYSAPENYKAFTADLGPKVNVSPYEDNEQMLAKVKASPSSYDIVVPTGYAVKTMAELGLLSELDHAQLPNLENLEDAFRESDYDEGNRYSVAKDYGVTSFFYRTDIVKESPKTLMEFFDLLPKYSKRRVNFLTGGEQNVALALAALGHDINTEDEAQLEEAKQLLFKVRPHVSSFKSTYIDDVINGNIELGFGWNGDVRRAIEDRAKNGKKDLVFVIPEGKTEYWVDNWCITKGAKNPAASHAWINFVLEPRNAAREMNYHQYPVPVKGIVEEATGELASLKALAADPIIAVPNEAIARFQSITQTPKSLRQREEIYTEFVARG
jgi:spermidine/putrescine transport system substrate-binding protein